VADFHLSECRRLHEELSSRPERSGVERSAVFFASLKATT
jgi:hypothetical protein